jgi:hypothetical protein
VNQAMAASALSLMTENTELKIGTLEFRACILGASAFMLLEDYSLLYINSIN